MTNNQQHTSTESPSFYAIIPADVRYCRDIESNAKLLYGEITALANKEGYCWATNKYFADLYDVDTRTIQRWIESLKKHNFIKVKLDKKSFNSTRYIYINHSRSAIKKTSTERQKCHGGYDKNATHNSKVNNTSPPLSSPPTKKSKVEKHIDKSLRSEEEEVPVYDILEHVPLNPSEKKRISKTYSEPEIATAIKAIEGIKPKKGYMALIMDALKKPNNYLQPDKNETFTENKRIALKYNQLYSKLHPKYAEKNAKLIDEDTILVRLDGCYTQLSLKADDFLSDIKKAYDQLERTMK